MTSGGSLATIDGRLAVSTRGSLRPHHGMVTHSVGALLGAARLQGAATQDGSAVRASRPRPHSGGSWPPDRECLADLLDVAII